MSKTSTSTSDITYTVEWREYTLSDTEGRIDDGCCDCDPSLGPDFASLEEAIAWARAEAAKDKLEIVTGTRYGNGCVIRNVYEICASVYDEDEEEVVPCSYEGEPWEDNDNETVDALDLHPEVKKAWRRANRSYCKWLDYEDCGEGYCGFRMALEDELGEDWDELDYIRWIG